MDKRYGQNPLTEEEIQEFKSEMNQEKVRPLGNAAMMAKVNKPPIQIKPFKMWTEKEGNRDLTSVRVYIGSMHLGTCDLVNKNEDLYTFFPLIVGFPEIISRKTLVEIEFELELQLREFIKKITL